MLATELTFEVAVPNAGYTWALWGDHWRLGERKADEPARSGFRWYRVDQEHPALFLEFAHLDPQDRDAICGFADRYGQLEINDVTPHHYESSWGDEAPDLRAVEYRVWYGSIAQLRHAIEVYGLLLEGMGAALSSRVRFRQQPGGPIWQVRNHNELTGDQLKRWISSNDPEEHAQAHARGVYGGKVREPIGPELADSMHEDEAQWIEVDPKEDLDAAADRANWTDVFRPDFNARTDPRLVVEAWLDDALTSHLNGPGFFEVRFGRTALSAERGVILAPKHLRALLWFQFARSVMLKQTFTDDFRRCKNAECRQWFALTPKERARRVFCSDACKVRHFRIRKETATKLKTQGRTVAQIAKELDTDDSTVKKWLREAKSKKGE